jgi:hypothetical protein
MIDCLTKLISNFPGAANRVRCTAHIVNLVSKIILRQFDDSKKTKNNQADVENLDVENLDESDKVNDDDEVEAALAGDLEREEQEVADDEDSDMSRNIAADLEEIEEAMREEILEVGKKVKPIQRVLFKVRFSCS